MKVVAVSGSPRKNGNTARLIEKCLEGCISAGATAETVFLQDLDIVPCRDPRRVRRRGGPGIALTGAARLRPVSPACL